MIARGNFFTAFAINCLGHCIGIHKNISQFSEINFMKGGIHTVNYLVAKQFKKSRSYNNLQEFLKDTFSQGSWYICKHGLIHRFRIGCLFHDYSFYCSHPGDDKDKSE